MDIILERILIATFCLIVGFGGFAVDHNYADPQHILAIFWWVFVGMFLISLFTYDIMKGKQRRREELYKAEGKERMRHIT